MAYGPRSMNMYSQTPVPLDGGLDLINPKIMIQAGTISECLNFERTDRVGYSRTLGMERFDGGMSPSLAYTNLVVVIHSAVDVFAPDRDEVFRLLPDGANHGPVLGCAAGAGSTRTNLAITNFDEWRQVQKVLADEGEVQLDFKSGATITITAIEKFGLSDANAKEAMLSRNLRFTGMRDTVTAPGDIASPVIGLHGFKDQVYAIKDLRVAYFTGGSSQIYPNDTIHKHGDVSPDNDVHVLDVKLLSGTYTGSNAVGLLLIDAAIPANGVYDIVRPHSGDVDSALTIATPADTVDTTPWAAQLYVSSDYDQSVANSVNEGWSSVKMGFAAEFEDGTTNGPFRLSRRGTFSNYSTDVINTTDYGTVGSTSDSSSGAGHDPIAGDEWSFENCSTVPEAFGEDSSSQKYLRRVINNSVLNGAYTPGNAYISNFPQFSGFSASPSLTVQGVEVTVKAKPTVTDPGIRGFSIAVQPVTGGTTLQVGSVPKTQLMQVDFSGPVQTIQTFVYGGPTELWGMDADTIKAGMDTGWGVAVQPWVQILSGNRAGIIDIYEVSIKVYYSLTVTDYYFWNGTDDVTADITSYFHADDGTAGDWATGDASGTFQITNIQSVGSGQRLYIMDGDEIRTDPGGGGLLIATVSSDMAFNGLDTLADIEAAKSRYEIITENFYADEDFEGMYGVSGAGRAFSWDGFYFTRIYTQADDSKDKPRHVTSHQKHLVLGFPSGSNQLSVAGNPLDFSGLNGATEIATGDPVTGYSKMNGTTLGIFGKKTIQGLVGTSIDNFSLTVLSPYEGAIEYTVRDIGKTVYCSYRGISIFDQTAAYGDFAGQRLSYLVTPYLLPRLQGTIPPIDAQAVTRGAVTAVPCRTKNQYRLYFQDGYCLVMTLAGSDQQPQFTIRAEQLMSDDGDAFVGYFVPRADTSFVNSLGVEHILMAPYSSSVDMDNYYVYEFEKSWTFDGAGIPAYLVTNENFYGSVFDYDTIRKARLHGLSLGYAPLSLHLEADYDPNTETIQTALESMNLSLPSQPAHALAPDYLPFTTLVNGAKRGRSFSMRFMSYSFLNADNDLSDPIFADACPPFVIQAVMPQYTENKGDI